MFINVIFNNPVLAVFIVYLAIISLVSMTVCMYDKKKARRGHIRQRVPERTLFLLSAIGGSVAMLATMLVIRHKTKHPSFMIGIPLIIIAQALIVYFLITQAVIL